VEKIKLSQAILVEGKYDAIRLDSLFDALILPTHGFRIYKDHQARAMLQRLAKQRGLVVATDSDAAGFQIRAYVKKFIPASQLWHVVIPAVPGKERRKAEGSKEGTLGVEGMDTERLLAAFAQVIRSQENRFPPVYVTKMELYRDGFSGAPGCNERFGRLLRELGLPQLMSVKVFCACVSQDEYVNAKERVRDENRSGL